MISVTKNDVDRAKQLFEKARENYKKTVAIAFPNGARVTVTHYHGSFPATVECQCYEEGYVLVRNLKSLKTSKRHYSDLMRMP